MAGISREASGKNLITFELDTRMFDRALQSFVKKYNHSVEYSVKKIGFEILRRAMLRTTRVCTGRMRNGWHVCQGGDTKILSTNGIKALNTCVEGEEVFTGKGFGKIEKLWKFLAPKKMLEISKRGFPENLKVTFNHVFPVVKYSLCPYMSISYRCRSNCVNHRWKKYLYCDPLYIRDQIINCEAKNIDLKTMALLSSPISFGEKEMNDLFTLTGYWLAKGGLTNGKYDGKRRGYSIYFWFHK